MSKNVGPAERMARVILGLAGILVAVLVTSCAGWVRGLVGLAGVAFLLTAAAGH